uniref:Uncharacterized protein n=1 Tax=Pyxicephalus adspersus TaxID=30357 RepID=A0AAV3AWN2_PYXAD|nr:TPA: hypothetical protein GDO54_008965 [Pyxicephalus adspersus]
MAPKSIKVYPTHLLCLKNTRTLCSNLFLFSRNIDCYSRKHLGAQEDSLKVMCILYRTMMNYEKELHFASITFMRG